MDKAYSLLLSLVLLTAEYWTVIISYLLNLVLLTALVLDSDYPLLA